MKIPVKIMSVILAAVMLCSIMPCVTFAAEVVSSGTCGDNLTWTLDSEGTLTISGEGEMTNWGSSFSVPWYGSRSSVKSVVIEEGVTSIGQCAFNWCRKLTSIAIPNSVTSIGDWAFYECKSLTSITIPDRVTSIGEYAFRYCESLASVTMGSGVTSIGSYAFGKCTSLKEVHITDIAAWCGIDFGGSGSNPLCYGGKLYVNGEEAVNLVIPDSVTSIGGYAFCGCRSLASVTIPDSVTSIGGYAFCGCRSLASVTIPDSVTSIGYGAFENCTSLASVTIPNSVTSIGEYAFYGCESLASVTIPNSVTSIGGFAFCDCHSLVSITIPDSVTSIGGYAFCGCTSLASVTIPNSVTSIGESAFYGCESLASVTMGSGVTSIGKWAFAWCSKLTSIAIPDGVTSIGYGAFENCTSLANIAVNSSNSEYSSENGVLFNKNKTELICCPEGKSGTYIIPNSVTSIGECAFYNCTSLASVTIPDSVTSIGPCAFENCRSLASITIPSSIQDIGDYAFGDCDSLKTIYYKGSKARWEHIGGKYAADKSVKIVCSDTETLPYTSTSSTTAKGSIEVSSSGQAQPFYSNRVSKNISIDGDYVIKNTSVTVESGYTLTVSGKILVENGTLRINGAASAGGLEIGTGGEVYVGGELSCGDIKTDGKARCMLEISGTVNAGDVSVLGSSDIRLSGKLYADDFFIKTSLNTSYFAAKGELWLRGDFTQKKTGALFWSSGKDNFRPVDGFSILLETNASGHKISFETPEQSYLYNLYAEKASSNEWSGNPTIKGLCCTYVKTGLGYNLYKNEILGSQAVAKQALSEIRKAAASTKSVKLGVGVSELGGMYSAANEALKEYLYAYTAGVEALYPSEISIAVHTWYETIPVYYDGKFRNIKFSFETADVLGQRCVNVNYTYQSSTGKPCFTFLTGNGNELAGAIKKYAEDKYSGAMAEYFSIPLNTYVKDKNSRIATLLWEGVKDLQINGWGVGIDGGKKYVNDFFRKGVNVYLDKVEDSLRSGGYSLFSAEADAEAEEVHTFKPFAAEESDEYFIQALLEETGCESLEDEALAKVEELDLSERLIVNIEGIEKCTALKKLNLSGNAVNDLEPLRALTALEELDLSGNTVSDISALGELVNLKRLVLKSNFTDDISVLQRNEKLEELDVSFNYVTDISPLEKLCGITMLNLTGNNVSDLAPLAGMTEMKVLCLGENIISDVGYLAAMKPEKLIIAQNMISDISKIDVSALRELDMSGNTVEDISVLSQAENLSELNMGDNLIFSIDALSGMDKLEKLSFSMNFVSDIEPAALCVSLSELECADNQIANFNAVSRLEKLRILDISDNNPEDISAIAGLGLQMLNVSGCGLYSDDVQYLPRSLVTLDISSNSLSDTEGFADMVYLSELNLSDNYISDFTALEALESLKTVTISGNPTEDIGELDWRVNVIDNTVSVAAEGIYFAEDLIFAAAGERTGQNVSCLPYYAEAGNLVWTSSDEGIAEVDEYGTVAAKAVGSAVIRAQRQGSEEVFAEYTVEVRKAMISNVSVGEGIVSADIENITETDYGSAEVIAAAYDGQTLTAAGRIEIEDFAPGYTRRIEAELDIPENGYVKIMLWDKNMQPLAEAVLQ